MAVRLRVTWDQGRSATVRAQKSWSLDALRNAIFETTGIPPEEQRLYHQHREMSAELPEAEPLKALRGYTGELTLVRCHPRQAQWYQRVAINWEVLEKAPSALQADEEVVQAALRQNGCALQFASTSLQGKEEIVHMAVQQNPDALEFAAEALKGNWQIVLAAMEKDVNAFRYADEELRADRELALMAVERSGAMLQFAAPDLQGDRDVVLAAVQENGAALQFASEDIRGDRDVVLAAVCANPYALEFAAEGFVPDHEIMRAALGDKEQAAVPTTYRWMGFQASPAQPEAPTRDPQVCADEDDLDERTRLELAVHWRLEPSGHVAHRLEPDLKVQCPPCCSACLIGRHLWCPRCGPAAVPEALKDMRFVAQKDPQRMRVEALKVRRFLGAGLSFTVADLRASAFKGVPS